MCRAVPNSWPVPLPGQSRPQPRRSSQYIGFRRQVFAKNHDAVAVPPSAPALAIPNNANVCVIGKGADSGPNLAAPWQPGDEGRIVLTVSNVNSILDDSWDFKINGVTVCNYDGGGATTVSFSTDLPPGITLALSAECVGEQNDNLFSVTVTVDGVPVIETEIGGDGTVGEVRDLGTFTT
jgi:hypothetical protein